MEKNMDKLNITLDGIGHALKDNNLMVPVYQRSYAWEKKHVDDLLSDLFTAIDKSEDDYFIGSIVICLNNKNNEVVDGQQRLATVSILLAAIRDYFFENDEKDRADLIQNDYLSKIDRRTQEKKPTLKLNNSDNNFFYTNIILKPNERDSINPTKESHNRLLQSYSLAKKSIDHFLKLTKEPVSRLLDLLDFIDEKLKIIWVTVPDHANAYTIFETLNDRGLELAISDLLKNFLLGQSGDRLEEVQNSWTEMYSLLESTENEELVVTFIRHYWSSIYGLTRERELYTNIKQKITSKQKAVELANNLSKASKIYVALIDTSHSFWSKFSEEAKTHMATLNMFRMVQLRPLLLSIMSAFKQNEIEQTLKFLVSASVRFLIHGGLGGGALETQYCNRAKEINLGEITKQKELTDKLSKVVPSDDQFESSFESASVSKQYLARYYLSVLENCAKKKDKPELIPNADTSAVNLEHILPKNPDTTWKFDKDNHKFYYNRLGNLAIMSSKLNNKISNSEFDKKKEYYKKSEVVLTNQIAEYESWDKDDIEDRQNKLAKYAVKAWRLK